MTGYKHQGRARALLLVALNWLMSICFIGIFLLCSQIVVSAKNNQSLASIIEQAIKLKDPTCRLISSRSNEGGNPPDLEKAVSSLWKCNGKDVAVAVTYLKTLEAAATFFGLGTMTQIMRKGYKRSKDGEELQPMVDEIGFFKNSSPGSLKGGRYRATYDVAFRKGKVVVIIEAFRSAVAQRTALLVAQSLPPA